MRVPRPPDWLLYLAVVAALLFVAVRGRDHADAPAPPPPLPAGEGQVLSQASPFDPALVVHVRDRAGDAAGTAFSVADAGVWLTARHVVERCAKAAIMVSETEGVEAKVLTLPTSEAAVLTTEAGAPALPLALGQPLLRGEAAYHPGYPHGRAGEVATRLLGRETLYLRSREVRTVPVLVWAEVGRTEGLKGALTGISGAPALDAEGRVVGVTVGEAPRRGRLYTTTPEAIAEALAAVRLKASPGAAGVALTRANYGFAADDLRRALRVAPVVCVSR